MSRSLLLDAVALQSAIGSQFHSQWHELFRYFPVSFKAAVERCDPEIRLLLDSVLILEPLVANGADLGQSMLRVGLPQGSASRRRLLVLCLASVLPRYMELRSDKIFGAISKFAGLPSEVGDRIHRWLRYLWCIYKAADIVNFLVFLQQGAYPTLQHRLLKLRPAAEPGLRGLSEDVLSRELLWSSFMELLTFTLPLVNFQRIRSYVIGSNSSNNHNDNVLGEDSTACSICHSDPAIHPSISSPSACPHVFCHYCVSANIAADPNFSCPHCGARLAVGHIKPLRSQCQTL